MPSTLVLRYSPDHLEADLADELDPNGLETEIVVALGCDARVSAEEVPHGQVNRGYWADEARSAQTGSRLWLLEGEAATLQNARRAEQYASEALAFLTQSRRVRAVRVHAEVELERIILTVSITMPSGIVQRFGPFVVS